MPSLLRLFASMSRLAVTAVLVLLTLASAAQAGTVRLQWKPNAEANLAGYVVLYGTASGVYTQSFEVGPTVTTVEVPDLPDGATYYFAVRAYNTSGLQSPLSNEASVYLSPKPPPPPVVTGMSPTSGPMGGNTQVTLTGANFTAGTVVRFGATAGTVQSVSAGSIVVRTPALPVGSVAVTVTRPDGQAATAPGTFTAMAPTPVISAVTPASGPTSGGTSVTITGSQFVSGATVTIGGAPAAVASLTSTAIVVTTPARAAGAADVKVTNPGGPSATRAAAFTYVAPAPVITAMSPTNGPTSGNALVTLSGMHFTAGAVVRFGSAAGAVQSISPTAIVVRTPALAAGTYPVTVTLPDGQSAAAPGAYTAVTPSLLITAVGPAWGPVTGGTSVTITGGQFQTGASVTVGGVPAAIASISPTAIVIMTPAHAAGAVDVKVVNPDGATAVSAGAFTYRAPAPVLTGVLPAAGPVSGGTVVTVTGEGFTGGAAVLFDGVEGVVTARTSTQIEAIAPARPAGAVTVTVRNEDGQTSSLPGAYTYEDEQETGTPTSTPPPPFVRYFAEGVHSGFFDTRFALANPHDTDASVTATFTDPFGTEVPMHIVVPAGGHVTVDRSNMPALANEAFATRFESDVEIGIDRTVQWDSAGYGAHSETGIASPRTSWYFAEGATHSGFDLFYLLQNPADETAVVRVRYLLGTGQVIERVHHVAPFARTNIWVNYDHPALASAEISAELTSLNGVPIVAERSMYQSLNGQLFTSGHNSGGVATPSTQWFLAEGTTGSTFDMFMLVANPNATPAKLHVTYLLAVGPPVVRSYTVPANSRFTVWVDYEDPRLAQADVSVVVTSTNDVPVIVERTMWWADRPGQPWTEAHNSAGVTSSAPAWVLADGESSTARGAVTYALVANTSPKATPVRFTLLTPQGRGRSVQATVAARSRYSIDVAMTFPEALDSRFGLLVESLDGAALVVERASYWNAGGITWAAGTASLGMPLAGSR